MGKMKSIVLLSAAIIVALITSIVTYHWLQGKAKEKEAVALKTQAVAVAVTDLQMGTVITKEMIKTVPFLKESLSSGYFSDPSSLQGRVVVSPIKSDEPILESRLAPVSVTTGGIVAAISPKKRALAVKVDKVIGVSGFIHPGNHVDVLVTLSTCGGKVSQPVTKTVLENIPVLAVGTEIERKDKQEKPSEVDVITLEVTPEEGEKLALSATEGRVLLALRNPIDTERVLTKGATIPTLLAYNYSGTSVQSGPKKEVATKKSTAPQVKRPAFTVEIIKGSTMSEVKFEGGV